MLLFFVLGERAVAPMPTEAATAEARPLAVEEPHDRGERDEAGEALCHRHIHATTMLGA